MSARPALAATGAALLVLVTACAAPKRLDRPAAARAPVAEAAPVPALPPLPPPPRASDRRVLPKVAPAASAPRPAVAAAATPSAGPATASGATAEPAPAEAESPATLRAAQEALQQSYQFTGLTDAQLAQQKSAEALLVRGDSAAALRALQRLNQELRGGSKAYVVQSGDTLWVISGKPEIYGNPLLWPLIWQSNLQALPNPDRVSAGQTLRIRPNPTVQDVVDAVTYAREQRQRSQTRIGEIHEAP